MFQHTAARRRLMFDVFNARYQNMFQHTAARRRLIIAAERLSTMVNVSTHSRPKAAEYHAYKLRAQYPVSTHSRPKAAEP